MKESIVVLPVLFLGLVPCLVLVITSPLMMGCAPRGAMFWIYLRGYIGRGSCLLAVLWADRFIVLQEQSL